MAAIRSATLGVCEPSSPAVESASAFGDVFKPASKFSSNTCLRDSSLDRLYTFCQGSALGQGLNFKGMEVGS